MKSVGVFLAVVALLLCAPGVAGHVATRNADDCSALGFLKGQLQCTLCETLLQRTGNPTLHEECLSCCTTTDADGDAESFVEPRYASAIVEYESIQWLRDPNAPQTELYTFVNKFLDKAAYRDLVQLRENLLARLPRLILIAEDGTTVSIRIEKWRAFQIDEFLSKKLGKS